MMAFRLAREAIGSAESAWIAGDDPIVERPDR